MVSYIFCGKFYNESSIKKNIIGFYQFYFITLSVSTFFKLKIIIVVPITLLGPILTKRVGIFDKL
jgi:hypothetical protein